MGGRLLRVLGAVRGGQTAPIVPRVDVKRLWVDELAETEAKGAEVLTGARRDPVVTLL